MHVGTRRIAVAGLLAAFSAVLLILSSVIETSSLFFIAAASFCVGIAVREWGVKYGLVFLVASTLLNFLVAPDKMYCITFVGMGIYLWMDEVIWNRIASAERIKHRKTLLWLGRFLVFNAMYIPAILWLKALFVGKLVLVIAIGQVVFVVYEKAHEYFQVFIWGKLRTKLMGKEYE